VSWTSRKQQPLKQLQLLLQSVKMGSQQQHQQLQQLQVQQRMQDHMARLPCRLTAHQQQASQLEQLQLL
jgi:hypothetical protein